MNTEKFKTAIEGVTAAKFAEIAGISAASVAAYRTGKQEVPPEVLKTALRIQDFFRSLTYDNQDRLELQRVIDGKSYNTRTAQLLGEFWNNLSPDNYNYVWEQLFKSPKGQYFIAGRGGAFTEYAVSVGNNSTSGGSRIVLITEDEAKKWLEEHGTSTEYAAAFDVIEG